MKLLAVNVLESVSHGHVFDSSKDQRTTLFHFQLVVYALVFVIVSLKYFL